MSVTMPHWIINGRFAGQPVTGVQRYAGQIVRAIDKQLDEDAGRSDLTVEMLVPPGTEVPFALSHIPVRTVGRASGHMWEQLELPRYAKSHGLLSLANTGPILKSSHIVCIHDTNTRTCPDSYSRNFRALYRVLHPALGHTANRIATVSQFSASELVRLGIAQSSKIIVAPNGFEHALAWKPVHNDATRKAAGPNTIVVLGSAAPHKNIAMLLGLAPRLAADGFQLAIAGLTDSKVFAGSAQASGSDTSTVQWLGRVSDDALAALLQDSLCLAFPSLTEGFGLPPLEAMARGCPVVVTNRASLPEICGAAALYAPPDAPDAWLAHFRSLRAEPELRRRQSELGRTQAAHFSWHRSAATYLAAMSGRQDPIVTQAVAR